MKILALAFAVNCNNSDWTQSTYLNLHARDTKPVFQAISDGFDQAISQIPGSYLDFIEPYLYLNRIKMNPSATDKTYSQPDSYHMTTYYRGNGVFDPNNQAYKEYDGHAGEPVVIEIPAFVYIPNRIITGIVYANAFTNNKYRHMTLMLGDMTAYESNLVLADIFDQGHTYDYIYNHFEDYREKTIRFHHKFANGTEENLAYLIILKNPARFIANREATFLR